MMIEDPESGYILPSPSQETEAAPKAFRVAIPDKTLQRIRERVEAYRWDALSEPEDAADWRYGPPLSFMRELCRY